MGAVESHAGGSVDRDQAAIEAAEARGARLLTDSGVPVIMAGDGTILVTVANAAKITGQGVRTIYGWIKKGLVDVRLTPTGQKRVVVSSLFKELK